MGLDHFERDARLSEPIECLGHDKFRAFLHGPTDLLFVHAAHQPARARMVLRIVHSRVANFASDERTCLVSNLFREPHGLAVELLDVALPVDDLQLVAVRVGG